MPPGPGVGEGGGEEGEQNVEGADLGVFVATDDETLIEVRAMCCEDVLTFEGAADEGDARVHDEGPHQEGAEHEGVATFIGGEERQDGEGVTEEGAACVAHEDFGR